MAVLRRVLPFKVLVILLSWTFLAVTDVLGADGGINHDTRGIGLNPAAGNLGNPNVFKNGDTGLSPHRARVNDEQNVDRGDSNTPPKKLFPIQYGKRDNPAVGYSPNRDSAQGGLPRSFNVGKGRLSGTDVHQGQGQQGVPSQDVAGRGSHRRANAVKIADHPACVADVKALCSSSSMANNFAVLDCLQYDVRSEKDISEKCQNFLWHYKKNLTTDARFDSAASEVCKDALNEFADCSVQQRGTGHLVSCLIEHKPNITNGNCKQFLTKMASIVFSDYRLVYKFTDACQQDITNLHCGRLHKEGEDVPHTQGRTIECVSTHVQEVQPDCKREILRIAELQADDYHMDRPLFYACREDRERFCQRTKAGGGKIYKCLFRHKFERDMSTACREKLTARQGLTRENFRANKALTEACRQDIRTYKCLKGEVPKMRQAKLSHVLLCLEGVQREGNPVTPECIAELRDIRRSLMEDYKISPNIVVKCQQEIKDHCNQGLHREGKTLHCLMDLARPRRKDNGAKVMERPISQECIAELKALLTEVNPAEDFSMDPALQEACQTVVDTACKNVKRGDARIIACLMEKIGTDKMNEDCEERLMEIQYFVARDFNLSPRLYRKCSEDAREHCSTINWYGRFPRTEDDIQPDSFVFSCLYRSMKANQLSRGCTFEVKRIMRQRAISVELEPRIEEPCLADLGEFCSEEVQKGQEIRCLQNQKVFSQLTKECRMAVANYTEDVDKDPSMDRILMRACTPMIKQFCDDVLEKDNAEATDIMECLIKHKNKADMDRKCFAGIEHHQLVTMQEWHFTYKFKEACKQDVLEHCRGVRKKSDVIKCLSETVRNDTLLEREQRLTRPCRKQLRFELFQRSENIRLDTGLEEACDMDRRQFCSNVSPGNARVIECLKKVGNRLSMKCHKVIFQRERQEAVDNAVDYTLMSTCKKMIKQYCSDVEGDMLTCLTRVQNQVDFDMNCRKVLQTRHQIRAKDIRLNPRLQGACKLDIPKFCRSELNHVEEGQQYEGRVINCLKIKFSANRLSRDCEDHMRDMMKEAAMDYKQDPVLAAACHTEITTMCLPSMTAGDNDGQGVIEECLKAKLTAGLIPNKRCKMEVIRILAESRADVHVDPLLHRACTLDIKHYCFSVQPGEGRQMSCLLAALEDKTVRLKTDCRKMLRDRVNMWEYAAKVAPPETFHDLVVQIQSSKSKNYFFIIILAILGIIFFGGLFCGRVTKRVRAELKNK